MKRQDYFPSTLEKQPEWLTNFADKVTPYGTTCGILAARLTAAVNDARWLAYMIGSWLFNSRSYPPACTAALELATGGTGNAPVVLPVFVPPPLPDGVAPTLPGALTRIFTLVKDMKNAPGYTDVMGNDLRIIGPAAPAAPLVPRMTLELEQGSGCQCVKLKFFKDGHEGVYIESLRGSGTWEFLAIDTASPYDDERPLLVAGQPEVRQYRARFWDKGDANGDWTDVMKVTVAP